MIVTIELSPQIVAATLLLPMVGYVWLLGMWRIEVHLHAEWMEEEAESIRRKPRNVKYPERAERKVAKLYDKHQMSAAEIKTFNVIYALQFWGSVCMWCGVVLLPVDIKLIAAVMYILAVVSMVMTFIHRKESLNAYL